MAGGSELGSAHVSIFPQMKGFRQNVAKEAGRAVSDLKNAFSKGFDAGKQGKTLGGAFKNGFGDGSKELNSEALQSFKKDVAQASQKNTDALLKYKAASVQVQAAQEKLNAATQKYGADSTQAQAAAIRLQQAELKQQAAADTLKESTENLKGAKERLKNLEAELAAQSSKSANGFGAAANAFKTGFSTIGSGVSGLVQRIPLVGSAVKSIGGAFTGATTVIRGAFGGVKSVASETAGAVKGALGRMWDGLPAGVRSTVSAFGSGFAAIGKTVGSFASNVGEKFAEISSKAVEHVKNMATGVVTAVGVGIAAVSAKLVDFGKQAFQSYSDYEQLSGGVAKLYGNMGMSLEDYAKQAGKSAESVRADWERNEAAQKTVMENAQNAWKNSGMSANAYMEQATSFSAALINALGGDTKKAADMTDVAMRAMSDNINTFGSNATDVQNAFNGFAKQNYTMLDNLKLGYGGTKEEMERLIKDANEWGAANGEASNLSIDSFSDVIQAIQQIQEKQHIAGTTAREAASTIEGSVSAMKAAWTNWLAELGKSDADMDAVTQNLANSVVAAAKNVIPRVGVIIKSFVHAIPGMFNTLVSTLPAPFQNAVNAVRGVFSDFGGIIAPVTAALAALGAGGFGGLLANIPLVGGMLKPLTGLLGGLASPIGIIIAMIGALIATSPQLRSEFGTMLTGVLNSLKQAFQMLQPSIQALMTALAQLAAAVMPVITNVIGQIIPLLTPIISTLVGVLVPVIQGVITVVTAVVQALTPVISQISGLVTGMVAAITPLIQGLAPLVEGVCQIVSGVIQALMPVIQALVPLVSGIISAIVGFIGSTLLPTIQAMLPFIQGVINGITSVVRGIVNVIQGVINMVAGLIHGNWQQAWNGFSQIVHGVVQGVLGFLGGIGSAIKGVFAGAGTWLLNAGSSIINGLLNGLKSAFGRVMSFVSGIGDWIVRHKGPLSYDKVMLKPAGLAIMQGFDKSLKTGWKDVQRTVNGMNAQINGGFDVDALKTGRANVSNGGGSTTYVQQTFNYPAIAPTSISTQQRLQTAAMPQW